MNASMMLDAGSGPADDRPPGHPIRHSPVGATAMMPEAAARSLTCVNRRHFLTGPIIGFPAVGTLADWFRKRVADSVHAGMVVGREDEALIGVIGRMRAAGATCAVIVDAAGRAIGLLDADDVLRRVVFDMPADQAVHSALPDGQSFARVDEPLFLALARMASDRSAKAVAIDAGGRPRGILHRDAALAAAMGGVLGALERAGSDDGIAGLARSKAAQSDVAAALLAEHQPAAVALEFIDAANLAAVRRLSEMARADIAADGWGDAPVAFAVIVMGSAGRAESLLAPDQDNGFILADHPAQDRARVDGYFAELGRRLTRDLAAVGFPLCAGNVMASNPAWRKTLPEWRAQVNDWAGARTNIAILNADIFFDFRCVYGDEALVADLRQHVTRVAQGNGPFLNQMAWRQGEEGSSVGLFGRLLGRDGSEGDRIDLKLHGTMPLVEAVRLLALWGGIEETGTKSRLAALLDRRVIERVDHDELAEAFEFLTGLLLRRQVDEALSKRSPVKVPAPTTFSPHERERLLETRRRIDSFRRSVSARLLGTAGGAGM
jgi:signal-transduction protein with cAMP-binding, CBS, and nucleotidyltransferase domain